MALKHDAQGFLAGDAIDLGRAISIWDEIKKDVHAIRRAVLGGSSPVGMGGGKPATPISVVTSINKPAPAYAKPIGRDSLGRFTKATGGLEEADPAVKALAAGIAAASVQVQPEPKKAVQPAGRDGGGRFVKGDGGTKPGADGGAGKDGAPGESTLRNFADRIAGAVSGATGGLEEADPAVKALAAGIAAASVQVQPEPKKAVQPAGRDGGGRFVKGDGGTKPGADGGAGKDGAPGESTLRNFADRIAGAVSGATGGLEEADPAVKAFQEVAQPLARGYQMITGDRDEKRKDGWFRKIHASLSGFRKDETAFNKAANKSLKNLEDKPVGDGEQTGFFGKMLAGIMGIGPFILAALTGLLSKLPGLVWLAEKTPSIGPETMAGGKAVTKGAASESGAAAKGLTSEAGAVAKGGLKGSAGALLKKVPILGALLSIGLGASEASNIESNDKTTREEKTTRHGRNMGEVAGGLGGAAAGAAIGTMILPVVGTVIGGVVGAVVGDWLGGNAGELIGMNFKAITESMASGWDAVTTQVSGLWAGVSAAFMVVSSAIGINWSAVGDAFKSVAAGIGKAWGDFVGLAKAGWDAFTGLFSAAYEGLKKIPIIGSGIQAAEDAAKATAAAAKEVADKAAAAAKDTAAKAASAVKDKAAEVTDKAVTTVKEAGVAAKTAYIEKTNPGAGPAGPAPVGVLNQAAAAAGSAAGSVVNVGKNALAAGERAAEMQKAVTGYTSDPKAQAMLMANMDHESAGFTRYSENLNYSSVDQIRKTFKGNKGITGMSDDQVQGLVKNPEKLANVVYADSNRGESSKLGNTEEGDGYKYRGRGALQITGKSNYAEIGKRLGLGDSLEKNPDMLANDPALAARASIEFLKMNKGRVDPALKSGDDAALRKVINGGYNGLPDVVAKTAKWDQKIQSGVIGTPAPSTVTALAQGPVVSPALATPVQIAHAAVPKAPTFAPPPVIAEAPPVFNPLASSADSKKPITVTVTAPDAGQDLKDRRIAHIVTGGFSA